MNRDLPPATPPENPALSDLPAPPAPLVPDAALALTAPPAPPDLLEVRRWTRDRQHTRRRSSRTVSQDLETLYTLLLNAAVATALLAHAVGVFWTGGGPGTGLLSGAHGRVEPVSAALGGCLLLAAAGLGALRRLGPVYLSAEQQGWWLTLPGARRRLMGRSARIILLILMLPTAALGAAAAALLGAWWPTALAAGALSATASLLVGVQLVRAQFVDASVGRLRLVLLACATALGAGAAWLPAGPVTAYTAGALAVGLIGATLVLRRRLVPMLEGVPEGRLRLAAQRRESLRGAGLAMDTRGLALALAPDPQAPRPTHRFPLVAVRPEAVRQPGPRVRTLLGVAQVDALLLVRQPWRLVALALLATAAAGSQVVLLPRTALLGCLLLAWCACLVSGDAARRAQRDPGPDELWPASPLTVRAGHLVAASLVMAGWCLVVAVLGYLLGTWGGASAALFLLAAPGWAGAALRSGFRGDADWSLIVPTPFAAIPAGLVQTLTAGPDAAALVALPALLAQRADAPGLELMGLQLLVDALVIAWGLRTGIRETGT